VAGIAYRFCAFAHSPAVTPPNVALQVDRRCLPSVGI